MPYSNLTKGYRVCIWCFSELCPTPIKPKATEFVFDVSRSYALLQSNQRLKSLYLMFLGAMPYSNQTKGYRVCIWCFSKLCPTPIKPKAKEFVFDVSRSNALLQYNQRLKSLYLMFLGAMPYSNLTKGYRVCIWCFSELCPTPIKPKAKEFVFDVSRSNALLQSNQRLKSLYLMFLGAMPYSNLTKGYRVCIWCFSELCPTPI